MAKLLNTPISWAVALTALITGTCSIWLIGDQFEEIPGSSRQVHAQISLIDEQRQALHALELRMTSQFVLKYILKRSVFDKNRMFLG